MTNIFYTIFSAVDNNAIQGALKKFSSSTVSLLNIIIGSLLGIVAVAIVAVLIYYAVKFGNKDVEVAAEAKKRFKAVLISLIIVLVILSAGMALINTVLTSVGDAPFDVTFKLLSL